MKRKLRDINQETQLLALDFLDYSVDDGKMPLWTKVSSKDFLVSLVSLLKTRDSPQVNEKILYLVKKWGTKFEKYYSIIPNFTDVYKQLLNNGLEFPEGNLSTYSKYVMSQEEVQEYNNNLSKGGRYDNSNDNDYDQRE